MATSLKRENYLTVKEFARYLKVHPQTVRRWLRDGKIKDYLQYGHYGHYRIRMVNLKISVLLGIALSMF